MTKDNLIVELNKRYAEELLAYHQYIASSNIIRGCMRSAVEKELIHNAKEELKHAKWLAKRIVELGGKPLINPDQWKEYSNCVYLEPTENILTVLVNSIRSEECAIENYTKLWIEVKDIDPTTTKLIEKILKDENEHKFDFEQIQEDYLVAMKTVIESVEKIRR